MFISLSNKQGNMNIIGNQLIFVTLMFVLVCYHITKYHRLCGLNNRDLFSHSFGEYKFKMELASLVL